MTAPDVAKGVTSGITPPSGGGSFVYEMNALSNTVGAVGLYATPQSPNTAFNPLVKGGDISAAIQRGVGNGLTGYAAFIFMLAQGTSITDKGYILGLSDGNPSHITLRKGTMQQGLPDEAPGGPNVVLARGSDAIPVGTWVHLRLEVVTNTSGDVVINCYQNDLTAHDVTSPFWASIPGITRFIDDGAGINSGSVPYVGGRAGYGGTFNGITRRAFFDQVRLLKQT